MHLNFHSVIFFIFFLKIWLNYANCCFAFSFSSTWYGSWRRCRYWLQKILCYLMPCHDTTPQNIHTRWRPSWPETRLRAFMFMCPRGHFIVDRFIVHISETICWVVFFYNQADVISESLKEPCISEKEKPDRQKHCACTDTLAKMWVREVKKKLNSSSFLLYTYCRTNCRKLCLWFQIR